MPKKTFVSNEILTASDVNTYLMDQAVMVFDSASARNTALPSPTEGMVVYLKDTDALQKRTASAWVDVNTDSGKVLQVVSTTKTDTFSASVVSGGFSATVTGLTASITPGSTSSKILVQATAHVSNGSTSNDGIGGFRLMRNSTAISIGDASGSRSRLSSFSGARGQEGNDIAITHATNLDSPSSTSSITYGVQLFNTAGGTETLYLNRSGTNTNAVNIGQTVSSITLMEVAG